MYVFYVQPPSALGVHPFIRHGFSVPRAYPPQANAKLLGALEWITTCILGMFSEISDSDFRRCVTEKTDSSRFSLFARVLLPHSPVAADSRLDMCNHKHQQSSHVRCSAEARRGTKRKPAADDSGLSLRLPLVRACRLGNWKNNRATPARSRTTCSQAHCPNPTL